MSGASSPLYVAVFGDLIGSRELEDRERATDELEQTLEDLNESLGDSIASEFCIAQGDEFQGLLQMQAPFDRVWWRYWKHMYPISKTRFGLGIGTLATSLSSPVTRLDGPCFHAARRSLERGKEEESLLWIEWADDPDLSEAMNQSLALFHSLLDDWAEVQWETMVLLAEHGSQVAVAEERGVAKQSVKDVVHGKSARGLECIESLHGLWQLVVAMAEARSDGID